MTSTRLQPRFERYTPAVLSVFRAVFGFLFAVHGATKLFAWPHGSGLDGTGPAMEVLMWPFWWAGIIELVTGLLIFVGLFTRAAAFIAAGEMAVAYFWQHLPNDLWPVVNRGEPAVLFSFAFLLLVFTGGGAYALDALLRRRR